MAKRTNFSIATLLLLTVIAALILGLFTAWGEHARLRERYDRDLNRITSVESFVGQIYGEKMSDRPRKSRRLFSEVDLSGMSFKNVTITTTEPSFQGAKFEGCDFSGAVIRGGGSSFQSCSFDGANLEGASLSGGGASFQMVTFVGANLRGATLAGSSFQVMSFRDADLTDATIKCPASISALQAVDLNGTTFFGADLSSIDPSSLSSGYFSDPPKYDAETKFPGGFDPVEAGWTSVEIDP